VSEPEPELIDKMPLYLGLVAIFLGMISLLGAVVKSLSLCLMALVSFLLAFGAMLWGAVATEYTRDKKDPRHIVARQGFFAGLLAAIMNSLILFGLFAIY